MMVPDLPLASLPFADAVLKATVILAGATVASFCLRRRTAAVRHLVWTLALGGALTVPLLSFVLPKWQVPLLRVAPESQASPGPGALLAQPAAALRVPEPLGRGGAASLPTVPSMERASAPTPATAAVPRFPDVTWPMALLIVWGLGAAVVLSRMALGVVAVRLLSRRTREIADGWWLPMARQLAAELGVTSRLRFRRSGRASMPVTAGIFRPSVIMPADADGWSEGRLRIVLLHELAHVKRCDCLTHLIAQAACALHWFNPLAWMAARRLRNERERACDDLVLAFGTRGPDYADELLDIARAMQADRYPGLLTAASLAMAHQSELEGRLIAILDPTVPRAGVSRKLGLAAAVLFGCAIVPLGAMQPWTAPPDAGAALAGAVSPSAHPPGGGGERRAGSGRAPQTPSPAPAPAPAPLTSPAPAARALDPEIESIAISIATSVGAIAGGAAAAIAETVAADGTLERVVASAAEAVQQAAAPAEGRKPDPRLVPALTAALKDNDKEVRETAMHALVQMRDPAAVEPLLQALKDPSPDVREGAAFGLGQLRDRRAVAPLVAALKDDNAGVREGAAFALGQLRDPSAIEGMGAALRDTDPDVRQQIAFALGQIRDRRAVEPLISALKDAAPGVREQAAFALGEIRDRAAVEGLVIAIRDANASVREQVAFALGQLRDPRATEALVEALKDQSADVRQQAAFALGQLAR